MVTRINNDTLIVFAGQTYHHIVSDFQEVKYVEMNSTQIFDAPENWISRFVVPTVAGFGCDSTNTATIQSELFGLVFE